MYYLKVTLWNDDLSMLHIYGKILMFPHQKCDFKVISVTNDKNNLTFVLLHLIEMPFNTYTNRADPDQAALTGAA